MKTPSYRLQKPNRAFVELHKGERTYLGRYGSPESKAEYHRLIAEWTSRGGAMPVPKDELTIVELGERFDVYAEQHYGAGSNELEHYRTVCKAMNKLYGRTKAADFGPLAFKAVRQELMSTPDQRPRKKAAAGDNPGEEPKHEPRPRCRGYVNKLTARLKRIFRWAASEELVPASIYAALQTVPGLQRGRCELPEAPKVMPVADGHVDATLAYLTPTLRNMINLQRLTGARPGEICGLRTADIDTSGKVWVARPVEHKTAHLGRQRTIFFGPRAQAILKPLLCKELEAPLFSPAQSERERREALHAARETPSGQGNEPGTNRVRNPKWTPGNHYTTDAYSKAIVYACRQAFGDDKSQHWTPHRLRHTYATKVRREYGLEASQVMLGHSSANITDAVYAERDEQKAREVALKIG